MWRFIRDSLRIVTRGHRTYWLWIVFLVALTVAGGFAYIRQLEEGLFVTGMRDPVSWGFYIGNFAFLVGVAAAAVALVIPAYLYKWKPIYEIVIYGELVAIAATLMCMLFVFVDLGRPDRFWHLIPLIGSLHFPGSILSWDIVVLTLYFLLCLVIATHVVYKRWTGKEYNKKFLWPLIILSIPAALAIHTVTAFVFNGLGARPYWNASILAPRFLASALASGPAIILILLLILRRFGHLAIQDRAIDKIAEIMAYAMGINLILLGAELFKDFYTSSHHVVHLEFLLGLHEHASTVVTASGWASIVFGVLGFLLLVVPKTRRHRVGLLAGCLLVYVSVYVEKGIALVIPGFTPGTLGEVFDYAPTMNELLVSAGVFGIGFLLLTLMLKVTVTVMQRDVQEA